MTKSTVIKTFVGSLIAMVAGLFLMVAGILLALATGTFEMTGSDVTGFHLSASAPAALGLAFFGVIAIAAGGIGQLVAWVGAVVNTSRVDDKTWFVLLLVLGLLSFGFIAMLVYIVAGPDGASATQQVQRPSGATS